MGSIGVQVPGSPPTMDDDSLGVVGSLSVVAHADSPATANVAAAATTRTFFTCASLSLAGRRGHPRASLAISGGFPVPGWADSLSVDIRRPLQGAACGLQDRSAAEAAADTSVLQGREAVGLSFASSRCSSWSHRDILFA